MNQGESTTSRRAVLAGSAAAVWAAPVIVAAANAPAAAASKPGPGAGLLVVRSPSIWGYIPYGQSSGSVFGNVYAGLAWPGVSAIITVRVELIDSTGQVVAAKDVLVGATVNSAGTDPNFEFTNVPAGNYTLRSTASGVVTNFQSGNDFISGNWSQNSVTTASAIHTM